MFPEVGDCVSRVLTSVSVLQMLFNHSREMSSSVGPIWPPAFDPEAGRQLSISLLGEVVTGPVEVIRTYRWVSTGLWPCLAVMMTTVDPSKPSFFNSAGLETAPIWTTIIRRTSIRRWWRFRM
jgi:hypothetical protein